MNAERVAPVPLLHNMSVAPRTTISHAGGGLVGSGILFSLAGADKVSSKPPLPRTLLRWLGIEEKPRMALGRLRALLDGHASALSYPAACPASGDARLASETCSDLLTVMTVLAKSSGHVYLRDKEPNLAAITHGRTVVLIIPENARSESC